MQLVFDPTCAKVSSELPFLSVVLTGILPHVTLHTAFKLGLKTLPLPFFFFFNLFPSAI